MMHLCAHCLIWVRATPSFGAALAAKCASRGPPEEEEEKEEQCALCLGLLQCGRGPLAEMDSPAMAEGFDMSTAANGQGGVTCSVSVSPFFDLHAAALIARAECENAGNTDAAAEGKRGEEEEQGQEQEHEKEHAEQEHAEEEGEGDRQQAAGVTAATAAAVATATVTTAEEPAFPCTLEYAQQAGRSRRNDVPPSLPATASRTFGGVQHPGFTAFLKEQMRRKLVAMLRRVYPDTPLVTQGSGVVVAAVVVGCGDVEREIASALHARIRLVRKRQCGGRKRNRQGKNVPENAEVADMLATVPNPMMTLQARSYDLQSVTTQEVIMALQELYHCPDRVLELAALHRRYCDLSLRWHWSVYREALYLTGRYRKLARDVPQSPWVLQNKRFGRFSVHELLEEPVKQGLRADSVQFHGAGREDMDVRMLGDGRPFVLEVINARLLPGSSESAAAQPSHWEAHINGRQGLNEHGDVEVADMQRVPISVYEEIKKGAEEKTKTYLCIVALSKRVPMAAVRARLEGVRDLQISQQTPFRVLHRRSNMARDKVVHWMRVVPYNDRFFQLELCTSAGTYVKEFVHGDLGRTTPSVGSLLGCRADIMQLDVTSVHLQVGADGAVKVS